jgi:hypothetical protein
MMLPLVALRTWLREEGHEAVFVEYDAGGGIVGGEPWETQGRIPAGFYDLALPTPATDRSVARATDSCGIE